MKFGETLLHKSEVMLKDLADSKRVHEYLVKQMVRWVTFWFSLFSCFSNREVGMCRLRRRLWSCPVYFGRLSIKTNSFSRSLCENTWTNMPRRYLISMPSCFSLLVRGVEIPFPALATFVRIGRTRNRRRCTLSHPISGNDRLTICFLLNIRPV